jgi:hypothetical protein
MYLQVSRDGTQVVVKLPTVLDKHYTFRIDQPHDTAAELLARDMDRRLEDAIRLAREKSYAQGWADAKAKRARATYFGNWLEIK